MADVGVTVIGAGVVGLAVAARLAPRHPDLILLERAPHHGMETSSRNSEVIHAGLYYQPGSLKARLCVEGNRLLYALCERYGVPHRRVTKIITATTPEELPALDHLLSRGMANGVELHRLSAAEVHGLEPHVRSAGAVLSPSTGIVSAHGLMDCLLQIAQENGAVLQCNAEVVGIERRTGDYQLTVRSEEKLETLTTETVVNAAGLEADTIAALAGIEVGKAGYALHYCKGSYFSVAASKWRLVSRLIYPVPAPESLGVHAVVGLDSRLRFGPDVEYLQGRRLDYRVDESKRAAFAASVRRLVPEIGEEDLVPDIAGIRPKLQGKGEPYRDFVVAEERERGLPGLVNLIGTDSPGLTSALAIARCVEELGFH